MKTKVAILDTGVSTFPPDRIKMGTSFVHDKSSSVLKPWWLPSHEHGTQMADIIRSIDPWCELYIAQITEGPKIREVDANSVDSVVKVSDFLNN